MSRKVIYKVLYPFKTIRATLVFYFSIIIGCILMVYLAVSINYSKASILSNSIKHTTQIIDLINYDIDTYIDYMDNISLIMANSEDVKSYIFDEGDNIDTSKALFNRIKAQFETVIKTRSDISNVVVAGDNRYFINDGACKINENVNVFEMDWAIDTLDKEEGSNISTSHVQNIIKDSYIWVITLSRIIDNPKSGNNPGIFFIDLNYEVISNLCDNNALGKKGYVFILDNDGEIIYHPQQQLLYSGLKQELVREAYEAKGSYFITDEGDNSRLYSISVSAKTGWRVIGVTNLNELLQELNVTKRILYATAIVLLIAAIGVSVLLGRTIIRPLNVLKDSMREVENSGFRKVDIDDFGPQEIKNLAVTFNVMTGEIEKLMEANVFEQEEKRKSELMALQSQINPHFLYNTLDSIIWMAESNDNSNVVVMTSALAKLMRQSIGSSEEVVSIGSEVNYIRSYLTIQKMRYKDRLEYEIDIDNDILEYTIVKLVLQPIVENAIYHGIKYKDGIGLISVRGFEVEDRLVIIVEDNGAGMDEHKLKSIIEGDNTEGGRRGVGIYNVINRLRLFYKDKASVTYSSILGEGTKVEIIIPKERV